MKLPNFCPECGQDMHEVWSPGEAPKDESGSPMSGVFDVDVGEGDDPRVDITCGRCGAGLAVAKLVQVLRVA